MNRIRKSPPAGSAAVLWLLLWAAVPAHAADPPMRITPQRIGIGAFFGGATVRITASIPKGRAVVVELVGKEIEEELMRKGRRWDIWMNVAEVDIDNVPCVYYVMSSRPELLAAGRAEYPWGYGVLQKSAVFRRGRRPIDRPELFREFIRLKEAKGLYAEFPGKVAVTTAAPQGAFAQGRFHIPTRIAPGTYDVYLYLLDGDTVTQRRHGSVDVALVGLPAFLDALASSHRLLYGVLAVVVAAAIGLLSGVAFKTKKEGMH